MKKLFAGTLALIMASALTLAAFAASDYSDDAPKPEPSVASGSGAAGGSAQQPADIVAANYFEQSSADTVYVSSSAVMDKSAVEALGDRGTTTTFVAPGYTVTIDPASISAPKDLSLSLGLLVTGNGIQITPLSKGSFGLTMQVSVSNSAFLGMTNPRLYYVADDGSITDLGSVTVEGNTATFSISHASAYIITNQAVAGALPTVQAPAQANPPTGAAV